MPSSVSSLTFNAVGRGGGGAAADQITSALGLGVEAFRWVCPGRPFSAGCIVTAVKAKAQNSTGSPSVTIAVQKGATAILSGTLTITGPLARSFTMANNGSELFDPGDVLTIDVNDTTLSTTSSLGNISFQVDLDWR